MRTRLSVVFAVIFAVIAVVFAQERKISVASFEPMPGSLDALENPVDDGNGEKCAIIKIETDQTGFTFEAGKARIPKIEQRVGEIWVWVQPGARQLSVHHQSLGHLRDYRIPCSIEAGKVYLLRLTTGTVHTIVEEAKKQVDVVQTGSFGADMKVSLLNDGPFTILLENL